MGELSRASLHGWAHAVCETLADAGIAPPSVPADWPQTTLDRQLFIRERVRPAFTRADHELWRQHVSAYRDAGIQLYASLVETPVLAPVHTAACPPRYAAAWCRMRHGGSTLASHRSSRHQGADACRLCGSADTSTLHALLACPALLSSRQRWWQRVRALCPVRVTSPSEGGEELVRWFFSARLPAAAAAANATFAYRVECAFGDGHA